MENASDAASLTRVEVAESYERLALETFETIDGLREASTIGLRALAREAVRRGKEDVEFFAQYRDEDTKKFQVPVETYTEFQIRLTQTTNVFKPTIYFTEGLLIQCFAMLDVFLRKSYETVIEKRPEMAAKLNISITLTQVLEAKSIKDFVEDRIADALNKTSFDSLATAFENLFKFCDLPFDPASVPEWKTVMEASQRRHLVVHNGGIVNSLYISRCRELGIPSGSMLTIDTKVSVSRADLVATLDRIQLLCCRTITFLLDKMWPDFGLEIAHEILTNRMYDLLCAKRYDEVISIGEFCASKFFLGKVGRIKQEARLRTAINLAQAYKWKGDQQGCNKLIDGNDFSAAGDNFQMVLLALTDQFDLIAKMLPDDPKHDRWFEVHVWPIYQDFRKSDQFATRYKSVNNSSFVSLDDSTE